MTQTLNPVRPTIPLAGGKAAAAVIVMFAVNGMILGGYGGSLPSLRERLDLDATQIAIMLFSGGVAGIVSMQVGGRLADSIGARRIVFAGLPILIAAALVLAFAPTYAFAIVAAALFGLGNGAMDVAMNALGVQVEAARGKPIMSRFHAFFSVGNFVGAGAVLLMALALGIDGAGIVAPLMITLAVIAVAVYVVLLRISPEAAVVSHSADGVKTRIPTMAWVLGAMALAFGLSEGTAVDWSSLHVTDVAGVDPTVGALGLIAVSGFMVVIRLLGDGLVARFGRRNVVRFGGICAALGYGTVTVVSSLPLLIAGWALVGFGVGMIAPQVYAVAGHLGGGRVLAVVVTFGYAAFLAGPAVVGFLVSHLGIQHAMAVPALLCVGIVFLALTMPTSDDDLAAARAGH
ncbi:MFS transporter [Microlunatus aurantiacus]|uniref:MFS transporter n=1 Tax=Microlunatus aurantiacus TaxID=446786 RepID=A0ABP7DYL6_9ACTN